MENKENNELANARNVLLDRAIKKVKEDIKDKSSLSKYLKAKTRTDNSVSRARNINTLKLAYNFYLLDFLRAVKSETTRSNHKLVIGSVNGAITAVNNKEVIKHILYINKSVRDILVHIDKKVLKEALYSVKCGSCGGVGDFELHISLFLNLTPSVPVICRKCSTISTIEFKAPEEAE